MPRFVVKRDGRLVEWRDNKVERAIIMAAREVGSTIANDTGRLGAVVNAVRNHAFTNADSPTIDEVHGAVVAALEANGYDAVAAAYDDYRTRRDESRAVATRPDPRVIADYIRIAKYARHVHGRRESRDEIFDRVLTMHRRRFEKLEMMQRWIDRIDSAMRADRVRGSMRAMQFAGKAIELNNVRLYNCAFTHVNRIRVFQEAFFTLLAGCGVGYSVQFHHVARLPKLVGCDPRRVKHFSVDDTIEGWADALGALVTAHMVTGDLMCFDYSKIRPEGTPLETSGGLAPGHVPLKELLDSVHAFLSERRGRRLRPIECHDIICMAAEAVLSGGIRRASLICLFSEHDSEMLYAKADGNFVPRGVPGVAPKNWWREMANNSMVLLRTSDCRASFSRVMTVSADNYGDPGGIFVWDTEHGCNPCAEIGMDPRLIVDEWEDGTHRFDWKHYSTHPLSRDAEDDRLACALYGNTTGFQFCNLCEVNVANCANESEFVAACEAASALGTMQASYTNFPYLGPVTERVVRREALLGVGLTGMMDRPDIAFNGEILRRGAAAVVAINAECAKAIGINRAARCTTVKPSGTASLELGAVGSGIHPHHAERYFRRVTANPKEAPAQLFRAVNPHMVDVKPNGDLSLVFPVQPVDGARTKTMPAIEFVSLVMRVYENWVKPGTNSGSDDTRLLTHNVSSTVIMSDDEREAVIDFVWENRHRIAAMSFAPRDIDDRFPFIPLRAVRTAADEALWSSIIMNYVPVDWSQLREDSLSSPLEPACSGGRCEVSYEQR